MKLIPNVVSSKLGRQILLSQKHSPKVLFAVGIVGVLGTVVLACKATMQLEEVLDEINEDILDAEETGRLIDTHGTKLHSDGETRLQMTKVYARSGLRVAKLYGPSVVVGVVSVGALCGSNHILSRRNMALTAAYAGLEKAFKEYRQRVIEDVGADKERDYRYPMCEIDDAKGKKVKVLDETASGLYARFFDSNSGSWSRTPEYNIIFLRAQQNYANDLLNSRGHVFLNEIYDMLGLERSQPAALVGWVKNGDGDNYVDFGIFDSRANTQFYDFVSGREGGIWLDFNVDGVIYDKI